MNFSFFGTPFSVELQEEYPVYDFQVDNSFKLFVDIKKFDLNIAQ